MPPDTSSLLTLALEEAARSKNSRVLTGAVFSTFVRDLSEREGNGALAHPERSFKDFLLEHPDAVWVVPRSRQDILVAHPAAAGELARKVAPALLRQDLYDAFTDHRESHEYLYDPEADEARPSHGPVAPVAPPAVIPIPSNTVAAEIAIRTAFVEGGSLDAADAEALRASLDRDKPLSAFAAAARERHLAKEWHDFKFARLLQRVNEWAVSEGVHWQPGWIQSESPASEGPQTPTAAHALGGMERLLGSLDEAELARIMIPLDVVARLLAARGDGR